jgi:hypothetical protein
MRYMMFIKHTEDYRAVYGVQGDRRRLRDHRGEVARGGARVRAALYGHTPEALADVRRRVRGAPARSGGADWQSIVTVTTRFPIESDLDAGNIGRLTGLINEVYDDAESGVWKRNKSLA